MAWALPHLAPMAIQFSRLEFYWLFYFVVAWLFAWGGYGVAYLRSARLREAPWHWSRVLGVVFILWPFVQYAYGIWLDFTLLITTDDVAGTTPAWLWWLAVQRRNWQNVLLPLVGLFLALGMHQRYGVPLAHRVRATLSEAWLWPRQTWTRAWVDGFGLFILIFAGYVALNILLAPLRQYDGGDDSQVFAALTPGLAFALALTAGLTEEVMFRGIMQPQLNKVMPVPLSIVIQSVFFALIHAGYGTLSHVLAPFAFGIMMGIVAQRWGLIPAIMVHALVDLVIFLAIVAGNGYGWTAVLIPFVLLEGVALPVVYYAPRVIRRLRARRRTPPGPPVDTL